MPVCSYVGLTGSVVQFSSVTVSMVFEDFDMSYEWEVE
jgi:hypothetical protein